MVIESSPILAGKKCLVQMISADTRQLIDEIKRTSRLDLPRDHKGYTYIYDPQTKKMNLVPAIIPVFGDTDYKEFGQEYKLIDMTGPEHKLKDMTSKVEIEAMDMHRRG